MNKKIFLLVIAIVAFVNDSLSQTSELDRTFHESGKINVVVAVITVIFIGIVVYLVKLDRKISKIEKDIK